jgi:hypothetical protein
MTAGGLSTKPPPPPPALAQPGFPAPLPAAISPLPLPLPEFLLPRPGACLFLTSLSSSSEPGPCEAQGGAGLTSKVSIPALAAQWRTSVPAERGSCLFTCGCGAGRGTGEESGEPVGEWKWPVVIVEAGVEERTARSTLAFGAAEGGSDGSLGDPLSTSHCTQHIVLLIHSGHP